MATQAQQSTVNVIGIFLRKEWSNAAHILLAFQRVNDAARAQDSSALRRW